MENYFNYFTEIEEHFQRRRGTLILGSTLDWALMETWKDAGIPLEAVLRGIDQAFDRYEQRPAKTRKINGLAWCSQAVLTAAEDMREAAVGAASPETETPEKPGFESKTIAAFLRRNAQGLSDIKLEAEVASAVRPVASSCASTLFKLADEADAGKLQRLEDVERHLTVLEEKLFAALLTATPDEDLVAVRTQADRDLLPYRRNMGAAQIDQLQRQYVHKKLLEKYSLSRLSLFYM